MERTNSAAALPLARVVQLFEALSRILLVGLFALYCLGFIVANIHLARFGYFSLGIFERRYAFAGFWAVAPVLLFWLMDHLLEKGSASVGHGGNARRAKMVRLLGGALLYVSTAMVIQQTAAQLLGARMSWGKWWVFGWAGMTLAQLVGGRAFRALRERLLPPEPPRLTADGRNVRSRRSALEILQMVNWGWSPLIVTYIVFFTYILFPEIPARWGGGGMQSVRLALSQEDGTTLSTLGLPMESTTTTAPIALVATTGEDYVFLVDSTRTLYVRRERIRAVSVTGMFRVPAQRKVVHAGSTTSSFWRSISGF